VCTFVPSSLGASTPDLFGLSYPPKQRHPRQVQVLDSAALRSWRHPLAHPTTQFMNIPRQHMPKYQNPHHFDTPDPPRWGCSYPIGLGCLHVTTEHESGGGRDVSIRPLSPCETLHDGNADRSLTTMAATSIWGTVGVCAQASRIVDAFHSAGSTLLQRLPGWRMRTTSLVYRVVRSAQYRVW
jgi:hypothetical protein